MRLCALTRLFSGKGLTVQPVLKKVSVLSLDGSEVEARDAAESLSFVLAPGAAYLVKAKTVDLMVPAQAEIVLEGYVTPGEERSEGPFGDHMTALCT